MYDLQKFQPPIFIQKTVYSLELKQTYSRNVIEGFNFEVPPIVRVLDAYGKPLKDKLVFAVISKVNGDILPYEY